MLATSNNPAVASAASTKTVDAKTTAAVNAAADKPANAQVAAAKGGADPSSLSSTLTAASKKLADSEKKKSFSSRPVSTISGNSMTSVDDSHECSGKQLDSQDSLSAMPTPRNTFLCPPTGINISEGESVQVTSSAAAPTSPTASEWSSEHSQRQLQILLEKKGVPSDKPARELHRAHDAAAAAAKSPADAAASATASAEEYIARQTPSVPSYDDSYCLLAQPALAPGYGPASREAAIAQLRFLAGSDA
ncbi:hypothetical protein LPJ75_006767, partial [Coemansia sp. RSA 2598]